MSLTVVPSPRAPRTAVKESWTLYGHDSEVLSAASCQDLFATCGADGVSLVWRLNERKKKGPENVCRVATGGPAVLDVCFVDGKRLATAQGDAIVSIWDLATGKKVRTASRVKVPGRTSWPVLNAVAMVSREMLCFGGDDGYVSFVDTRSPGVVSTVNRRAPITALTTVEDGALLSGNACGYVSGFEERMSWREFMHTKCDSDAVASIACSSNGGQAAVYTMSGRLSLVDTQPFAANPQERLLSFLNLSYGDDRALKRGDWSDALDTLAFPSADGGVACIAPSRFRAGPARLLRGGSVAENEEEEGAGELYFSAFIQSKYVLFGGSAPMSLREL